MDDVVKTVNQGAALSVYKHRFRLLLPRKGRILEAGFLIQCADVGRCTLSEAGFQSMMANDGILCPKHMYFMLFQLRIVRCS